MDCGRSVLRGLTIPRDRCDDLNMTNAEINQRREQNLSELRALLARTDAMLESSSGMVERAQSRHIQQRADSLTRLFTLFAVNGLSLR